MILKITKKNNETIFVSAETFTVCRINVGQEVKDKVFTSLKERHDFLAGVIMDKTNYSSQSIFFAFDITRSDISNLLIAYPKPSNQEHDTIVTEDVAFLMSNDGKTIERLA